MSGADNTAKETGVAKRRPGRPRKDAAASQDVAAVEALPEPQHAEDVMQERREEEYPELAAQNSDEEGVDNTGLPEPQEGKVTIEATTPADLHLGDERVIYGNGEDGTDRPKTAKVTKELADALVKAGVAKLV